MGGYYRACTRRPAWRNPLFRPHSRLASTSLYCFRRYDSVCAMRDAKIESYLTTIAKTQLQPAASPLVSDALQRIGRAAPMAYAQPLQLLALRKYLRVQNRKHKDLASIWSWTAEHMSQSINTAPSEDGIMSLGFELMNKASQVKRAFALANPGYTLAVSPPRDLERQVTLWNGNLGVRAAANHLFSRAVELLSKPDYDLPARLTAVIFFTKWLEDFAVSPEPGNAAPGTSDHGTLRAVDFIVMRGRTVVAGVTRATIPSQWTASGWAGKLAEATAGTGLVGPLANPYEPWHWALR
jgi:hypothetical protein